jgi:hypothetical protein
MKLKLLLLMMLFSMSLKAQTYVPEKPKNAIIVYYTPIGVDALPDYEKRVSDLMIFAQTWFGNQMLKQGYVDANNAGKTFGLVKDASLGRVQIHRVLGTHPPSYFEGKNKAYEINTEVMNYFAAHPEINISSHIIIMFNGVPNGPFNGYGRHCVFYDEVTTTAESISSGAVPAGTIHEMGHAFNLPHDQEKRTEATNPNYGISLMGTGIYSFNKSFLTATDCAILNHTEVFNDDQNPYYGDVKASIKNIQAVYNTSTNAIDLSGKFISDVPVKNILYYNDPIIGNGDDGDYNAITWETKPVLTDSFKVSFPLEEYIIRYPSAKNNGDVFQYPYHLNLFLLHENGQKSLFTYKYTFNNKVPVFSFNTKTEIAKTGWQIVRPNTDEVAVDGNATGFLDNMIDGNPATYWHSKYGAGATSYPHTFTVDMGASKTLTGFTVNQQNKLARSVKDIDLLVSSNGTDFTLVNSYVLVNSTANIAYDFPTAFTFRYFKIIAKTAHDGFQYASLGEIGMYGVQPIPPKPELAKTSWAIVTPNADEETVGEGAVNGRLTNLIDGNDLSYWHSKYTPANDATVYPHTFTVNMGSPQTSTGFSIVQKADLTKSIKDIDFYTSNNGTDFTLINAYTLANTAGKSYYDFNESFTFQYFKVVAKTSSSASQLATLAEIGLYDTPPAIKNAVPKNGWTIVTPNADEELTGQGPVNGRLALLIDGDESSYWHSKWQPANQATSFPHTFTIDMGAAKKIVGFGVAQKPDLGRAVRDMDLYVSNDGVDFTLVKSYQLAYSESIYYLSLPAPLTFRYFKMVAKTAVDGAQYAALSEINMYERQFSTLPVTELKFTAKYVPNTVQLKWTTATETNSDYFDVIRFVDKDHTKSIASVKAVGNSNTLQSYAFTDHDPLPGTSYYQLKQYDKDGALGATSVVRAVNILERPYQLTVQSVNANEVSFNVYSAKAGIASVFITNMLGQRVAVKSVRLSIGNNQFSLPVNSMGMHLLSSDFGSEVISKKFIK